VPAELVADVSSSSVHVCVSGIEQRRSPAIDQRLVIPIELVEASRPKMQQLHRESHVADVRQYASDLSHGSEEVAGSHEPVNLNHSFEARHLVVGVAARATDSAGGRCLRAGERCDTNAAQHRSMPSSLQPNEYLLVTQSTLLWQVQQYKHADTRTQQAMAGIYHEDAPPRLSFAASRSIALRWPNNVMPRISKSRSVRSAMLSRPSSAKPLDSKVC